MAYMVDQPMAATLLQKNAISMVWAELAIEKPTDQKHRAMEIQKNCLLSFPIGLRYMTVTPKAKLIINVTNNKNENNIGLLFNIKLRPLIFFDIIVAG